MHLTTYSDELWFTKIGPEFRPTLLRCVVTYTVRSSYVVVRIHTVKLTPQILVVVYELPLT